MKKITALILMIALLAVCVAPAFADRPVPDDGYVPKREWRLSQGKGAYYLNQPGETHESSGDGWSWKSQTSYRATFAGNEFKYLEFTNKYEYQDAEGKDGATVVYGITSGGTITSVTATDNKGKVHQCKYNPEDDIWYDESGEPWYWGKDASALVEKYEPEFKWYKNTVCLLGLPIRDLKPGLTDKWYTVVPVDLTKDATYTYPLIAGSIYYLGECQVNVKDGQVTTDFSLPEGLCWDEKHCLQWFTSLDDITTDFLNDPKGSFTFGQPVSISGDLKGQDVALLFICNQAEYRIPLFYSNKCFLTRFYSTQDHVKAAQAEMTTLLAKIK